jgi:hypothetical protein
MGNKVEITEPTEERVIKDKVFRYFLEQPDTIRPDQVIAVQHFARRGETVTLREVDARRGDAHGAFFTKAEIKAGDHLRDPSRVEDIRRAPEGEREPEGLARSESPESVDLTQMDEGEIQSWLNGDSGARKPSIPQVIAAVEQIADDEDRAVVAEAVRDAERSASGRDPRSSLVERLDAVAGRDEEDEDEDED